MNKKTLCILLSMAMLSHQVTYASDQSLSGDVGPSGQSEVVIDMPIQEEEVAHTNEETMDANMEGNGASCSDVTVLEATASEAAPMKDTKTGECDSEAGELKEDQGAYAGPRSLFRTAYGAEYYQGDWDPDANRNAIRIPNVYPVQSANYLPSLPAAAVTSSLYKTYGPNGCADVQIQVSSGSNGSLNRTEVTVNLKTGQLLILRPMGASKHSYFHISYINDNKGRRFSDFAKLYHPSDSYYSRYEYAWLMRVTCDMAGNWDAHADGWNTVNNEGDRVYYGPAHWTMHLNVAHDYGPWTTASEPSCAVQGTQRRTCRDCGSVQTQSTSVLGHAFSDGYYMGANDGTYFKRCTRPGCDARTDVKYNPYTVVFDANGGSGNMNSQPFVYQTPVALFINQYTRAYHTFQGWNIQPDGGGAAYEDGQSVLNLTKIYGDTVTLYAQWLPNTYIITFADGMDGRQNEQKGLLYTGMLGTLPEFIRKGYTLLGFYTEPDGGTRITEETDVPHEDTTYHAHWSANEYRIMFHTKNAHCDIDGKVVTYDKPIGILPVPDLEDYAFLGWYAQPYGEEKTERIMYGEALPEPGQKIVPAYEYTVDRDMDAYAYFTLVFRDLGDGTNKRPGKDGAIGTEDDNLYLNGTDGVQVPVMTGKYTKERMVSTGRKMISIWMMRGVNISRVQTEPLARRMITGMMEMGGIHGPDRIASLKPRMILPSPMDGIESPVPQMTGWITVKPIHPPAAGRGMTGFLERKMMRYGPMGLTALPVQKTMYGFIPDWMVFMGPGMTGMTTRIFTHLPMSVRDLMVNSGRRMMRYGLMVRIVFQGMRMTCF